MDGWTCPACGRGFAHRNQRHACGTWTIESVFPDAAGQQVVEAVRAAAPPDAVLEVTKTQVGLRHRTRFAWVWRPPDGIARRLPAASVVLSFALARRLRSQRLREVVEPRPGLFVHHVVLAGPDDVDAEIRGWLAEAWQRAA